MSVAIEDYYDMEKQTANGKIGQIEISGNRIRTPINLPTQKEINYMNNTPLVDDDAVDSFRMGVLVEWFDIDRLNRISRRGRELNHVISYINYKLNLMNRPVTGIHFKFDGTVQGLSDQNIRDILYLQSQINVNIIEAPHYRGAENYREVINIANQWKIDERLDNPLMATISDVGDVETIIGNLNNIDCCGIDFSSQSIPLLQRIRTDLRSHNAWVHAFEVPHCYRQLDWEGTIGILNNYYGIDSFNHQVIHPKASQYHFIRQSEMTDDEKIFEAQRGRVFDPTSYATPRLSDLINTLGQDHSMSDTCNCQVCRDSTLGTLMSDLDFTFMNIRVHETLANQNESNTFRNRIENDEELEYIRTKTFASRLIE